MESCLEAVQSYSADNAQMKQCLRNMDEQMCTKVNKITFMALENQVEVDSKYLYQEVPDCKKRLQACLTATRDDCQQLALRVNQFAEQTFARVASLVEDATDKKLARYTKVAQDFSRFFTSENLQE